MEREQPERFQAILKKIAGRIPGIDTIDTERTTDGRLLLRFNDKGFQDPFYAQQMSDGTLKVFAYLLLLEDPAPPSFLCIEEPENGLYQKLLETLANEFRAHASEGRGGSQVFVTTHQPYFVDALGQPTEVWILEKGADGYSTIRRASDDPIVNNMGRGGLAVGVACGTVTISTPGERMHVEVLVEDARQGSPRHPDSQDHRRPAHLFEWRCRTHTDEDDMTTQPSRKPWHEVVQLRDDLKSGELSLAVFAADLYDVVMQKGQRPVYEQPGEFFALTYPTYNLRELVKGRGPAPGRPERQGVPEPVGQLRAAARPIRSLRSGIWCTTRTGCTTCRPSRNSRRTSASSRPKPGWRRCASTRSTWKRALRRQGRMGQSECSGTRGAFWLSNWQGQMVSGPFTPTVRTPSGRRHRRNRWWRNSCQGRNETVFSTLVLVDEVLMYLRAQVETVPALPAGRLISFFQYLTQAVVKVDPLRHGGLPAGLRPQEARRLGKRAASRPF